LHVCRRSRPGAVWNRVMRGERHAGAGSVPLLRCFSTHCPRRDDARILANLRPMLQGCDLGYDGTVHLQNYVIISLVKQGQGATRPKRLAILKPSCCCVRRLHAARIESLQVLSPTSVWKRGGCVCAFVVVPGRPARRAGQGLSEQPVIGRGDWPRRRDRQDQHPFRVRTTLTLAGA
jgi:hypothetical protein